MKLLRENSNKQDKAAFFLYTRNLSVHNMRLLERLVKRMSMQIKEEREQDIFYSLLTGKDSIQEIAEKYNLSIEKVVFLCEVAVTEIINGWDNMRKAQQELQSVKVQYRNYKSLLSGENIGCTPVRITVPFKECDIPAECIKILSMPLANLEIQPRILRRLRRYNIYLVEDLLRFIKKNGFDALGKLYGVGAKSCEDLYLILKQKNILENKDNCYLFQYVFI